MRIVLLGPPGSGKGTQARKLVEKYHVRQISTGDLLRAAVAAGSDLGKRAKAAMDAGELVSDAIVLGIIEERLREADTRPGFILDGFPRNIPQAQELDNRLAWLGRPLQLGIYISVDHEILVKRLTGRLTCAGCGAIFNRFYSPPAKAGVCDQCGAHELRHRSDDNESTVRNRLAVYESETQPLIAYYRAQHKLRTVSGVGEVDEIFENLVNVIDADIRPLEAKVVEPQRLPSGPGRSGVIAGGGVVAHEPVSIRAASREPGADRARNVSGRSASGTPGAARAGATASAGKPAGKRARAEKAGEKSSMPAARKQAAPAKKSAAKKTATKKKPKTKAAAKKATAKKARKGAAARRKVAKKVASGRKARTATATKAAPRRRTANKATANKARKAPARKKTAAKAAPRTAKKATKKATKKAVRRKATKKKRVARKTGPARATRATTARKSKKKAKKAAGRKKTGRR